MSLVEGKVSLVFLSSFCFFFFSSSIEDRRKAGGGAKGTQTSASLYPAISREEVGDALAVGLVEVAGIARLGRNALFAQVVVLRQEKDGGKGCECLSF